MKGRQTIYRLIIIWTFSSFLFVMCFQEKDKAVKERLTIAVENYFNSSKNLPLADSIKIHKISDIIFAKMNTSNEKRKILEILKSYNSNQDSTLNKMIYEFSFPIAYNTKHTILNDTTELKSILYDFKEFWNPVDEDYRKAEVILLKSMNNKPFKDLLILKSSSIRNYYRQYSFFTTKNGDSVVFINAFCQILDYPVDSCGVFVLKKIDWKNKLMLVNDGGDCYWSILINLTKKEVEYFNVNGVA